MTKGIPMDKVFLELSKDPEFRKADRAIKPRFDIVKQVIVRRVDLQMSQTELAEKASTHQSRISKIESAEYDLRLSSLTSIAEALGCEVCIQLVPFDEDRYQTIRLPDEEISSETTFQVTTDPAISVKWG